MTEPDAAHVTELVAAQLPQYAHLPVRPVARQGWDNRTFRLGDDLSVRLPSAEWYGPGIVKEDLALPKLAGRLPVVVPEVVASMPATPLFDRPWTVRRWLPGESLDAASWAEGGLDRDQFAVDLGAVLKALRSVPTDGGPWAGGHSFLRGCHVSGYADQVQQELSGASAAGFAQDASSIWDAAMRTVWSSDPVWFHGDVALGNVLVTDGRLSALIDFGQCGVGDPACDLVPAWTMFTRSERRLFRDAVGLDDATWQRARAWALWKALITVNDPTSAQYEVQKAALEQVLDDDVTSEAR